MRRRTKVVYVHDCSLPKEREKVVDISPYSNAFDKWCFRLKKYITVQRNSDSVQYFRSNAAFLKEKNRQLGTPEFQNIIHPFSIFARRKRIFMCFLWLWVLFVFPYLGTFRAMHYMDPNQKLQVMDYLMATVQGLLFLDIFYRFFLGYTQDQTREIVLERKKIARHYFLTYFWFDAIPSTVYLITWFIEHLDVNYKILASLTQVLRVARVPLMISNFHLLCKTVGINKSLITCLILSLLAFFIVHWWSCFLRLISVVRELNNIQPEDSWYFKMMADGEKLLLSSGQLDEAFTDSIDFDTIYTYFQYMSIVMCHFFGAGIGLYRTHDGLEMIVFACILLSGLMFYVYVMAKMLQLFGTVSVSETKYDEVVAQAGEYMIMKKFPSRLKNRINKYYDYKFNKTFFSEKEILNSLSEHLRMEVLLYSCRNLLEKVPIFRGLSRAASGCILGLIKQEIYLPHDIVFSGDDQQGTLYFVLYGTCSISFLGTEVMHIIDGDEFGDAKDFTKADIDYMRYTVEAVEPCEIYSLQKADIDYCRLTYPDITNKLEIMMRQMVKNYNTASSMARVTNDSDDILAELRKGHILHKGRKRNVMF